MKDKRTNNCVPVLDSISCQVAFILQSAASPFHLFVCFIQGETKEEGGKDDKQIKRTDLKYSLLSDNLSFFFKINFY